ncbi:MAG: hypothetical protein JSW49_02060 [candidate division WOR-3 bacterium]|nr:MAG: hypothetical protein JSW49_02060 [candidate division WOR-3 bacterium]
MQRLPFLIVGISVLFFITCLDAPRDNMYDADNPNKAYFSMIVYELGLYPIEGSVVNLTQNDTIVKSDTTDSNGIAAFEEIDPGIYYITATTEYYQPIASGPESLWAEAYVVDHRMEFLTLHFEDDLLGTPSPYRLMIESGHWAVVVSDEEPQTHSTPHVYLGNDSMPSGCALSLCELDAEHFFFSVRLNVLGTEESNWNAGVVFRFQDKYNYYALTLSPDTTYCYVLRDGQLSYLRAIARETKVDTWHNIKVEHREGEPTIRINIDDAVYFALYDNILSGGRVGLIVSDNDGPIPASTYFDDFTLDLSYSHVQ